LGLAAQAGALLPQQGGPALIALPANNLRNPNGKSREGITMDTVSMDIKVVGSRGLFDGYPWISRVRV
jgi:hypothetical protein